mgnify:CR=1 FL=1
MDRRYKQRIEKYWNSMERKCDVALSNIEPNDWFDLWHTHPDWSGKGNRVINLPRVTQLTYSVLQKAEALMEDRKEEAQCFALFKSDTSLNSVYIHTDNPNGSEFPFAFQGVEWGKENGILAEVVNKKTHEIGLSNLGGEQSFFVRKRV